MKPILLTLTKKPPIFMVSEKSIIKKLTAPIHSGFFVCAN